MVTLRTLQRAAAGAVFLFAGAAGAVPTYETPPGGNNAPFTGVASGLPYTKNVVCDGLLCGTMEIDTYQTENVTFPSGARGQGVRINGIFTPNSHLKDRDRYHFLQAVIEDTLPPDFNDGDPNDTPPRHADPTPITVPYIDTPPGGYHGQNFDFLPYYDEGEFPEFFDRPANGFALVETTCETDAGGNKVNCQATVKFETWLVCVIDEDFGPDANFAKDDSYILAALLGWEWGFTITNAVANPDVTDFSDWTVTAIPFRWITGTPSADFVNATNQTYGRNEGGTDSRDEFNIVLEDCTECVRIPEPGTLWIFLLAVAAVALVPFALRRREAAA